MMKKNIKQIKFNGTWLQQYLKTFNDHFKPAHKTKLQVYRHLTFKVPPNVLVGNFP